MGMKTKTLLQAAIGGFAAVALLAGQAAAQTTAELEARIAKLEAENARTGVVRSGTGMDLTFYGYARVDADKDTNYNMGPNNLHFDNITSASAEDGKFGSHAFQTRLGVRGSTGDLKFNFEGDFYGAGGGSFRIRHAYGEFAGLTIGQTWSNWNADGNPSAMVDFNGVPGGAGYRAMQLRYAHKFADNLTVSASIEDDFASYKALPILTGALRYTDGSNVYKLTAMSRRLNDLGGNEVSGWGASLSTVLKPGKAERFRASTSWGRHFEPAKLWQGHRSAGRAGDREIGL
ncbi:hypothetical protein MASR2M74_03760 [Paracoccaceae bacterium]